MLRNSPALDLPCHLTGKRSLGSSRTELGSPPEFVPSYLTALRPFTVSLPTTLWSHYILQGQGHAHAAAHAERSNTTLSVAFAHLVQQRDRNARAGAADGMAESNRSTIDVEFIAIEIQFAVTGKHLRSESLIEFDESKVLELQIVFFLELAQS